MSSLLTYSSIHSETEGFYFHFHSIHLKLKSFKNLNVLHCVSAKASVEIKNLHLIQNVQLKNTFLSVSIMWCAPQWCLRSAVHDSSSEACDQTHEQRCYSVGMSVNTQQTKDYVKVLNYLTN